METVAVPSDAPSKWSAAAYVRMSTAAQDCSIQYQLDAIGRYAYERGLAVVRTFVDAGRSGLRLENRPGLLSLLDEVTGAHCGFSVVLVYDVSRWGRFQDVDESAYYEHLCRRSGVSVLYCAEAFVADGTPMNALLKGIKRIMAAEYSRELGAKVLAAQSRFASMGYKQGGKPGYGLRRVSVKADGATRTPLLAGERKSALTDRVALVPGPAEEVAMVRRIYQLYVAQDLSDRRIAALLRKEGAPRLPGVPWSATAVRRILVNPRYCGDLLYNRTTRRMGKAIARNHAAEWICCHDALPAIIDHSLFDRAQEIRQRRDSGSQREAVLQQLRALYQRHGTVSIALCRHDPSLPGGNTIKALFGGYLRAYAAAGLPPLGTASGSLHARTSRLLVTDLLADVRHYTVLAGGTADATAWHNTVLLNDSVRVKVAVAACRQDAAGRRRWRIPLCLAMPADFMLCGLMDCDNRGIGRYVLLALNEFAQDAMFITERSMARVANACHDNLAQMFGLSGDASAA
ncbi:recombinase family protein [Duganella sp. FT109W]|uniref:Recombinase family protein n=1 Tax=Duganella margarita TaxID=2692170 RepID=A0ABW9WGS3_9BURK|nr:recombinase family protein [Duganella margarita]MYN40334.1 recombinase family protein [Duganella margarita]